MKDTVSVSTQVGGQTLTIETGLLARQAAGAVTVALGDTVVFSAVTTAKPREGIDYFPMQVEYREKYYSAGRFPGGYFKRESRPSEKEILTARLTDRPIRPLFPNGYRDDLQINNTLLSADGVHETDFLSVVAASAALHISEIPFMGPIAAVRVGRVDGRLIINPTHEERLKGDLDLLYSGTQERFLMMEGGANEISEEDFLAAMKFGHEAVVAIIAIQHELRAKLGLAEKRIVDGVELEFQMAPETEAPSEMNVYIPAARTFLAAELATCTLHNILTPRGAKVRDALAWSQYLGEAVNLYAGRSDNVISSHCWPRASADSTSARAAAASTTKSAGRLGGVSISAACAWR